MTDRRRDGHLGSGAGGRPGGGGTALGRSGASPALLRARGRSRRIAAALALDALIVAGELAAGLVAHSTGLLADAGHDVADAAALLMALVATRLALRSPTAEHSFGFHRATIVVALANVAVAVVVALLVGALGVVRILHPHPVDGGIVAIVAAGAVIGNGAAALALRDGTRDLGSRVAVLHLATDAVASLGVLGAGLVVFATGGRVTVVDPAVSLAIAALVVVEGWRLGRESVDVLLEASPADLDLGALSAAMSSVAGVSDVHDLHCWSLSSDVRALSAHVVLAGHPSLERAQLVGDAIKARVGAPFSIAHTTLELECERCVEPEGAACAIDTSSRLEVSS